MGVESSRTQIKFGVIVFTLDFPSKRFFQFLGEMHVQHSLDVICINYWILPDHSERVGFKGLISLLDHFYIFF